MAEEQKAPSGPDLAQGVAIEDFVDGKLLGHVGDEEVLLVRRGDEIFAVGAHCTHYHGPLAEGLGRRRKRALPVASRLFRFAHGEAARAPALSPIACWNVEARDGRIVVRQKREQPKAARQNRQSRRAAANHHRRRRRRRLCRRGNAAAARLPRAAS